MSKATTEIQKKLTAIKAKITKLDTEFKDEKDDYLERKLEIHKQDAENTTAWKKKRYVLNSKYVELNDSYQSLTAKLNSLNKGQ